MDKDAEEKYKKLLLLRKKMELLELKKKKEEEQVLNYLILFCQYHRVTVPFTEINRGKAKKS